MQIGNRFRCYPTLAQAQTLLQWIGCQRYVYNAKVGEDQYFRRFARKSLAHTGQFAPIDQQYSHFKTELTPWLSEVPSQILRNGAVLWKQAYSRYLFVFEALKVKNMTKKAKPKQDEQGRWLRNGAAAKSGLNKAILASCWGQTKVFLQYKARRQGKLAIEVPAFYSSQECGACGHIHQDNRVSQSGFVCQSCGHTDHADHNAAKVIAGRGVRQLLAGKGVKKEKKTCRVTRQKVGAEGSEPGAAVRPTLGETEVSRLGGNTLALWSLTQETPAITPLGV